MTPRPMLVLGLMSGTSADGIDVALARISGLPPNLNAKLLGHTSFRFPPSIRKEILHVAEQQSITAGELSQLNFRLGELFADAALAACRRFRVSPRRISLVGSHGQTVFHQGRPIPFFGHPTSSTLQIGETSVIAARTGITTVADFRPADIAVGGQGAPLVPYVDYLLYHHPKLGRVSLNLGGIANITVIPANAKPSQVFAFDTGPANILIDALVSQFTKGRKRFDKNALLARRGHINDHLIRHLMKDPYLKLRPPKSTGREYFGARYVKNLITFGRTHKIGPADLLYTTTYFTAASIVDALRRFVLPKHKISQLIVSGGGAQNPLVMLLLSVLLVGIAPQSDASISSPRTSGRAAHSFERIEVITSDHLRVPSKAKEAFAFALLAYETFHQRPANIPSATGARRPVILGKISYAPPR
jgi:anhydro-N-acetylmuramic acid kinase